VIWHYCGQLYYVFVTIYMCMTCYYYHVKLLSKLMLNMMLLSYSVLSINTRTESKELILKTFGTDSFGVPIGTEFTGNRITRGTEPIGSVVPN
jgi:hypothetical protein